jgi:hypothetical protein
VHQHVLSIPFFRPKPDDNEATRDGEAYRIEKLRREFPDVVDAGRQSNE